MQGKGYVIGCALAALVGCAQAPSASQVQADVTEAQAVLAAASVALAGFEAAACPVGATCAMTPAERDVQAAITAAQAALAAYSATPSASNKAALTQSLAGVSGKVTALK